MMVWTNEELQTRETSNSIAVFIGDYELKRSGLSPEKYIESLDIFHQPCDFVEHVPYLRGYWVGVYK